VITHAVDTGRNVLLDYYRCPVPLGEVRTQSGLSTAAGYFRVGDAVAFGQCASARPASHVTSQLADVVGEMRIEEQVPLLPFDLNEVVTNLRQERYRRNGFSFLERTTSADATQKLYYLVRPLLGVGIRKHLQKVRLRGWENIAFPEWPVDGSVDSLMEQVMAAAISAHGHSIPFIWFWPEGATACAMMTHDVEGPEGVDFCRTLMEIDEAHGVKSAFQLIPEGREEVWRRTAAMLRARGFEVNLHDLNHDGLLFAERQEFLRRAKRINAYAREFECDGFRSGAMYREQSWFDAFEFAYDMSVPNAAHLEPQRGGCCTVMPYFVGNILELPLTMVQDYSLFHILNDYSINLWRRQIATIMQKHGLVSVIAHPDYLLGQPQREVYLELLQHLVELRENKNLWVALPGEVNSWWRNRHQMTLVGDGAGWRVEGPGSDRARVAYASLEGDRVKYVLEPVRSH
jgi:hypothetical protein